LFDQQEESQTLKIISKTNIEDIVKEQDSSKASFILKEDYFR
jgi:hypothetical protein